MNNVELIQQIRSGNNKEALKEMYKPFNSVSYFIKQHGGSDDEARDIFQESLLIFYKNAQKPEFKLTSALSTYLFAISKYLWKDELKKKNRIASFDVKDAPEEVLDYAVEELKDKWLDKTLNALGGRCLEILKLFYYEKFSMEQIAEKLGYKNVDTVKTQKYKCIEQAKLMAAESNIKSQIETV